MLEKIYDKWPVPDPKIVLRDFNVKIGREDIFGLNIDQSTSEIM